MIKLYARQVAPEYQKSPLWYFDELPSGVAIVGNKYFREITFEEYDNIIENADDAVYCAEMIRQGKAEQINYDHIEDVVYDFFLPTGDRLYSIRDIDDWKELLTDGSIKTDKDGFILEALRLITGLEYRMTTIHGTVQGEWNCVIYPAKYGEEFIGEIQADYFNTGTEWIVHDSDFEPEHPSEIHGYSLYCYSWNDSGIKREIAEGTGVDPENIVLYRFKGYDRMPKYELVK